MNPTTNDAAPVCRCAQGDIMRNTILMLLALGVLAPVQAAAQGPADRFAVHGFLTQGFGVSESEPVLGIGTKPTADYRTAALQFRYDISPEGQLVLQLSHRRLGNSPIMAIEKEIELNWAFYRHRFGPVSVRAGRFPAAKGIYNEVRTVGTVLPTFRAPISIYSDGTETVDGVGVAWRLELGAWSTETEAYVGGMEYKAVFFTPVEPVVYVYRGERNHGGQFWLNTPKEGVRLGLGGIRFEEPTRWGHAWQASLDADLDRALARAEYVYVNATEVDVWAGYVQGRFKVTEKIHAVAEWQLGDIEFKLPFPVARMRLHEDRALGLNYMPAANLVFKIEAHDSEGYGYERFIPPGPIPTNRHVIASVSVSF
jgi:hypothetical protein